VEEKEDDKDDEYENNKKKRPIELQLPLNWNEYGMEEFIELVTTTTAVNWSQLG
jgi:hypothetical protein